MMHESQYPCYSLEDRLHTLVDPSPDQHAFVTALIACSLAAESPPLTTSDGFRFPSRVNPAQAVPPPAELSRAMDRARHKSSPSSERFIGSFLPRPAAGDQTGSAAFELDEDDLFTSGIGSPERPQPPRRPLLISSIRAANPSPLPRLLRPPGGILEALPERVGPLPPPPPSSSTSSSPASPVAAFPRMIPTIPRPAPSSVLHMPQSAPVNVPAPRLRQPPVETMMCEADDDEEMLPPHEMVARSRARESPMTTFSVLEGAGRTLKGRDLRQVRNAVWRKTGLLD